MRISKYILIIHLIFSLNIFSQETKTHKGLTKNGISEYQYYEDENQERILNGNFKYSRKIDEDKSGKYYILFSENGFFKNGKKNGAWIFKMETFNGNKKVLNCKIDGSFSDDLKSGSWNQITSKSSLNLTFLNDTIVGNFKVMGNCNASGNYDGQKCIIEGNFENNGKWDGEFKLIEPDREIIALFKNNYLISLIDKKPSTGEISSKYSLQINLSNFQESIKEHKTISFPYKDY